MPIHDPIDDHARNIKGLRDSIGFKFDDIAVYIAIAVGFPNSVKNFSFEEKAMLNLITETSRSLALKAGKNGKSSNRLA